jgi:ATP-dependent DNA helicase RecQ
MLYQLLKKHWGYDEFLPLQQEAVQCVLGARDSLLVLPTGGGKSLCYQLPALCRPGMAVVVSPLISLMKDQVDAARAMGIPAATWNSLVSAEQQRRIRAAIQAEQLKLLYVSPERLLTDTMSELLDAHRPAFIAVDEAHCISQWGHDFRPEYRQLGMLKQRFAGVSLHGFTATATEQVRGDILASLNMADPALLVGQFHRPNLIYHVEQRLPGLNQVCSVMERFRGQSGIVYAITRDRVEKISGLLNQLGFRTRPYHAGMADADRERNQQALIDDQLDAIVATVAFGMGIDKSNVRYVIHAELPRSIESYQQETGRAGRDGLEAECWLFYSTGDFLTWQRIIEAAAAEQRESALRSLQQMLDYCTSLTCRHRLLVGHFGQQLTKDCQSCDVCLGRLAVADDALLLAQKILSCVARCDERFGADHITKVLTGSSEARLLKFGHEKLSTWGLLKEHTRPQIRDWINQLLGQRYLESVPVPGQTDGYRVLRLTDAGRSVLRGQLTPTLSKPSERTAAVTAAAIVDSWEGVDRGLFEALRGLRTQLATAATLPAYIVFSDATLRDLARRRPTEERRLQDVHGIGQQKASRYGAEVLALIREYCSQHDLEPNQSAIGRVRRGGLGQVPNSAALAAFPLFDQGLSVPEVAQRMNRANSTVTEYLVDYIAARQITDPTRWVEPSLAETIVAVTTYVDSDRLRPIHDALHGQVGYDAIRITLACERNRVAKNQSNPSE